MILYYARNCIWLVAPILLMNVLLMKKLPKMYQTEIFSNGIPMWISIGENTFRVAIFALPLLMPLHIATFSQKIGLVVYLAGVILYFLSWAMQIMFPQSQWSMSRYGFMAPSFTPLLWLIGVAMVGNSLYIEIPYHPWVYIGLSIVFLIFHNLHSWRVYSLARHG
jgi:hypothetical protein